jgi:hypothetical protein|nr:MAG TPA_asm: tail protein [Caudoviricetes sp.]
MIIYNSNGETLLDIPIDDNSYRYRAIRQGDKVYLYFSLTEHVEIPVGSYIDYQGQRYTLWRPEDLTKHGMRNLEYAATFGGWWELLNTVKYKHLSAMPIKLKFQLTGKPRFFLDLMVRNMNLAGEGGWSVGSCIDAPEKTLAFSHEYCLEVLNRMADEWETEFELSGKTIHFGKVERFKDNPLPLSYGRGNGFKTGVGRKNQGEKPPTSILYVQGGERNIDPTTYGASSLLLPKNQELEYEGRRYRIDKDGMFVTRADRPLMNHNEDSLDCTHIYPSRVGTISDVITVDAENHLYDIIDSSIPDNLDYSACRIPGETATIIFQSGVMTGEEFDIEQTSEEMTGYIHAERRFKLVPVEKEGGTIPNANRKPAVGDTYAVFNISLPPAYVCDNETQAGASWDMFREAARSLYNKEEETFSFTGELDGIWAKSQWLEVGGRMVPGSYILFDDPQFQPEGVKIRITAVKDYINRPYSPELELSNVPVAGFVSSELSKIESNEVKNDDRYSGAMHYTRRRWRDAVEAQEMLEKAIKDYSAGIDPVWVRTMSLLVGHENLQFRFVNSKTNPRTVDPDFIYDDATQVFTAPVSILQHMTLGISEIKGEHKVSEYKFWDLPRYVSPPLGDFGCLYLYAKCSKSSEAGEFVLSEEPHDMEEGGYYYFLVGLLGSQYDGVRSFVTCYGFTEVLPGRITVDRIVSTDGTTYFNLGIGEIGGVIRFASGTTGYENITDKPDLSKYGTINMLNSIQEYLQNQIDDKIETYYQSANPWNSWPSGTEPEHVGDMWYNTSTGVLQCYVGPSSNTWREIVDKSAIDAAREIAEAADVKADGKRRVFLSTPYPPYDAGDQWIEYNGSGSMRVCVQGRQSGRYVSSDWQLSSADGNTKASIDRGVISAAGFLTFGGSAGLVGSGDIRIWSGGTTAENATFKVYANGNIDSKGNIYITNANGNKLAGFSGGGTSGDSVRIWAGGSTPESGTFKVYQNGNAYIGGLRMESGGLFSDNQYSGLSNSKFFLYSNGGSAFLGFSATGKWAGIGLNTLPATTGIAALLRLENTNTEYGTKYGAVITVSGGTKNIALLATGNIRVKGEVVADTIVAAKIRAASNINDDGTSYSYLDGVTFGFNDYDLDKVRFQVQNGIIVGVKKE